MNTISIKFVQSILICALLLLTLSGAQSKPIQPERTEIPPITLPNLPSSCIKGVACDRWGYCWFASWGGLYAKSPAGIYTVFSKTNSGIGHNYCSDVKVDENGYVWVSHHGWPVVGVSVLDHKGTIEDKSDDKWKKFYDTDGLGNMMVGTLEIDSSGNKWFGHWSGVSVLDDKGTPFTKSDDTWTQHPSESYGLVKGPKEAIVFNTNQSGKPWVGGDFGLNYQAGGSNWVEVLWPGGNICFAGYSFDTWDIAMDKRGHMYVGTWSCGVGEYYSYSWKTYDTGDIHEGVDLRNNNVHAVAVDPDDNKWFGTEGGTARLDNFGEWTAFVPGQDDWITASEIDAIDFDTRGHGWFGSCGSGGGIHEYIPPNSDSSLITPADGGNVYSPDRQVEIDIDGGAVSSNTVMTYTAVNEIEDTPDKFADIVEEPVPTGDFLGIRLFDLTAVISSTTTPVTSTTVPYTITVLYTDDGVGTAIEDTLGLYYWDDGDKLWTQDDITNTLNITDNILIGELSHLSIFGVLGETKWLYLPLVTK